MNSLGIVQKHFPGVKKVTDAHGPIEIEVTPADARKGRRKSHQTCAMAVACRRKFNLDGVLLSHSVAYLVKGPRATRYVVPPSVQREIVSFDRGVEFKPGDYWLNPPGGQQRLGSRTAVPAGKRSARRVARTRHSVPGVRAALGSSQG